MVRIKVVVLGTGSQQLTTLTGFDNVSCQSGLKAAPLQAEDNVRGHTEKYIKTECVGKRTRWRN